MNVFNFQKEDIILLVGEGNFTFSITLISYLRKSGFTNFTNFFATCLEKEEDSIISKDIKDYLLNEGVNLLFGVDATKLSHHAVLGNNTFNKIIFNFPHVGGKMKIHLNRQLLEDFFKESSLLTTNTGEVIVSLCAGQGGTPADGVKRRWDDSWQINEMAARGDLILKATRTFPHEILDTYVSTGYRGKKKSFNTQNAVIHFFRKGVQLIISVDNLMNRKNPQLVDGIMMSHIHKEQFTKNPFLNSKSPQSYLINVLEHICRTIDSDYKLISELPIFTKVTDYSDQACCIVKGEKYFLRKHLLQVAPEKNSEKTFVIRGLCFNEFTNDFKVAPAECHVAILGNNCNRISQSFFGELKCLFQVYLHSTYHNKCRLDANSWFQLHDPVRGGIDINLDKILSKVFNINWRELWCRDITINMDCEIPLIILPSLYNQTFKFDVTFKTKKVPLDISKLYILIQHLNCSLIQSAKLLDIFKKDDSSVTYCFRLVYKSYDSALCRGKAIEYHNVIVQAVAGLMQLEIV